MAKKQQIILTHGTSTPSVDIISLGEVLVQHGSTAAEQGLHTVAEIDGTKKLITFPSKEWISDEIAKVDAGGINQTITNLQEKVNGIDAAYKQADGEIAADIAEIEGRIATIEGADSGKSIRTIASEEVAAIVDGAPEAFDTLKEIAEWIGEDTTNAATLATDVDNLKKVVSDYTGEGAIKTAITEVSTNLNGVTERVNTLEGDVKDLQDESKNYALQTTVNGIDERVTSIEDGYVKTVKINEQAFAVQENGTIIDLSALVIDGGTY